MLRIQPHAVDDLREAHAWYEEQRPGLGNEFLLCIEAILDQITANPVRFPLIHREIKRAVVRRFP